MLSEEVALSIHEITMFTNSIATAVIRHPGFHSQNSLLLGSDSVASGVVQYKRVESLQFYSEIVGNIVYMDKTCGYGSLIGRNTG